MNSTELTLVLHPKGYKGFKIRIEQDFSMRKMGSIKKIIIYTSDFTTNEVTWSQLVSNILSKSRRSPIIFRCPILVIFSEFLRFPLSVFQF